MPTPSAPRHIGIKEVLVKDLHPNPYNPRMLFDKDPMQTLQASIKAVGILVPLTVYFDKHKKRYVILDGQRRWICAQALGLAKVPVNQVDEPDLVQNILTMFQIHKLRQDWELMPTALKVELLMKETKDTNPETLAALTGLDVAVIVRCKKLLSYDKSFQDLMLDPDPNNRVKADFFIELYPVLHDRDVQTFKWFSEPKFIKQMLGKYKDESRTIKAVTDFRLVKQHITKARKIHAITKLSVRLKEFSETPSIPLAHLEIAEATTHAEATAIVRKISALETSIATLDPEEFYGEEALWVAMAKLVIAFQKKLREADKRLLN